MIEPSEQVTTHVLPMEDRNHLRRKLNQDIVAFGVDVNYLAMQSIPGVQGRNRIRIRALAIEHSNESQLHTSLDRVDANRLCDDLSTYLQRRVFGRARRWDQPNHASVDGNE